jgi:hypothetical protein
MTTGARTRELSRLGVKNVVILPQRQTRSSPANRGTPASLPTNKLGTSSPNRQVSTIRSQPAGRMSICRVSVASTPRSFGSGLPLRAGGIADSSAWRTVRRCTPCLSASARIDNPSTLRSRRISANSSTLDLTLQPHLHDQRSGPSGSPITVKWGQLKPSQSSRRVAKVGPNQTVTTTLRRHTGRATSSRHPGAHSGCRGDAQGK